MRESRGKFLIFLDSDDRLCPNGVEAGVACMAERPSSGLVYGRHRCMHEDGTPYPSPSQHKFHDDLYRGLLHYNFIGMVAAVMFRREVFDVVGGFNTDISPTADYDLYLRIASRYPSNYHYEIVAEYRIYGTSMSSDLAVMMRGVLISLQSQQRNIRGRKEYEEAYQEGMKFWRTYYGEPLYLEIARHYGDIRRWRRTLRGLGYLLRYYPQCIGFHAKSKADKMIARLRNKIAPGRDQGVGP